VRKVAALTLTMASIVVAVVLLVVSMRTHPWWYESGDSACGNPGMIRVDGQVTNLGGCDGNLARARTVSVRRGARIDIHMIEQDTSAGFQPVIPLPTSTNIKALRLVSHSNGRAGASYLAVGPGSATLVSTTQFCDRGRTRQELAPCPVIRVLVTS
jgi:hypothetical protein